MKNSFNPDLSVRLLSVFTKNSEGPTFPEIAYCKKGAASAEVLTCLEPVELDNTVSACLNMLHPLARNFISTEVKNFRLTGLITSELEKTTWIVKAPDWAGQGELAEGLEKLDKGWAFKFKIANLGIVLFPTQILIVYIDIVPAFKLSNLTAVPVAKMILHSFLRTGGSFSNGGYKGIPFSRIFSRDEQRESAMQRMGSNGVDLIQGLCGKEITMVDVVKGLLPSECFTEGPTGRSSESAFLMGDRFLVSTFVKTDWDGQGRAFSNQDYMDLVRLSRAEDDKYEPVRDQDQNIYNSIIKTFENVAFSPSAEGIVCWIKPLAGQDFLHQQFKRDRYEAVYFQLYLLALHQRYALVNFARRLDEETPPAEELQRYSKITDEQALAGIESLAEQMRTLRRDVSDFYLRAFFQQPATLSNHQEFYSSLQKALGVSELLDQVRQASSELEYLIGSLHGRISLQHHQEGLAKQGDQHNSLLKKISDLISAQERTERITFSITLMVEIVAIPVYVHDYLSHSLRLSEKIALIGSILMPIIAVTCTIFMYLKDKKKNSEI